jgi:hypothetical protein
MSDFNNANDGIRLFAKGGIAAALAINSGALVAVISQLGELSGSIPARELSIAFTLWTIGVSSAAVAWVTAALSAMCYANGKRAPEVILSSLTALAVLASIGSFALGAMNIGYAIEHPL